MREWVKNKIGEKYLIPLLGVWDNFNDINFNTLPNQFALKATHGSGYNVIVRDKQTMDIKVTKKKFDNWMNESFAYNCGFEMHYRDIKPRIIAEEYIANLDGEIADYRFFCFGGKPHSIFVDIGSGTQKHQRSIFDLNWNEQDYTVTWPKLSKTPSKPAKLKEMIELASILSQGFAFVRVDLYLIDEQIYLGEMTFTSQSGYAKFSDPSVALEYGNLLELPPVYQLPKKIK